MIAEEKLNGFSFGESIAFFGKAIAGPDIIIIGSDTMLLYYNEEQPPSFTNFKTVATVSLWRPFHYVTPM